MLSSQQLSGHGIDYFASTLLLLGARSLGFIFSLRPGLLSPSALLVAFCSCGRCGHPSLLVLYLLGAGLRCSGLRLLLRPRIAFLAVRIATLSPLCFTLVAVFTDLLLLLSIPGRGLRASEQLRLLRTWHTSLRVLLSSLLSSNIVNGKAKSR